MEVPRSLSVLHSTLDVLPCCHCLSRCCMASGPSRPQSLPAVVTAVIASATLDDCRRKQILSLPAIVAAGVISVTVHLLPCCCCHTHLCMAAGEKRTQSLPAVVAAVMISITIHLLSCCQCHRHFCMPAGESRPQSLPAVSASFTSV